MITKVIGRDSKFCLRGKTYETIIFPFSRCVMTGDNKFLRHSVTEKFIKEDQKIFEKNEQLSNSFLKRAVDAFDFNYTGVNKQLMNPKFIPEMHDTLLELKQLEINSILMSRFPKKYHPSIRQAMTTYDDRRSMDLFFRTMSVDDIPSLEQKSPLVYRMLHNNPEDVLYVGYGPHDIFMAKQRGFDTALFTGFLLDVDNKKESVEKIMKACQPNFIIEDGLLNLLKLVSDDVITNDDIKVTRRVDRYETRDLCQYQQIPSTEERERAALIEKYLVILGLLFCVMWVFGFLYEAVTYRDLWGRRLWEGEDFVTESIFWFLFYPLFVVFLGLSKLMDSKAFLMGSEAFLFLIFAGVTFPIGPIIYFAHYLDSLWYKRFGKKRPRRLSTAQLYED